MTEIAQNFLSFAVAKGALQFGEFTLNSGRVSPYFLNTGMFSSGDSLSVLSGFYAETIKKHITGNFMLYGPAYKGIALAASTAISLFEKFDLSVEYAFNRKEAKDHGEQGQVVGNLSGRVVIVEDVITSGLSIDKAVEIISATHATPIAVIISLDRMEYSLNDDRSAVDQCREKHGLQVHSVANVYDLLDFVLHSRELMHFGQSVRNYMDKYVVNMHNS